MRVEPAIAVAVGAALPRAVEPVARVATGTLTPHAVPGLLVRERSDAETAALVDLLHRGTIDGAVLARTSRFTFNEHPYEVRTIRDGSRHVDAVLKPAPFQAPQELFGFEVARAMGAADLAPAVAARDDGSVAIEYLRGVSGKRAGLRSSDDLQRQFALRYMEHHGLGARDAHRSARLARELVGAVDYVTADLDRHRGNFIVDEVGRRTWSIDRGHLGAGVLRADDPLVPHLVQFGQRARRTDRGTLAVRLLPETRELLRSADRQAIAAAHERLAASRVASTRPFGRVDDLIRSNAFLEGAMARLDQTVSHGQYEFLPAGSSPR